VLAGVSTATSAMFAGFTGFGLFYTESKDEERRRAGGLEVVGSGEVGEVDNARADVLERLGARCDDRNTRGAKASLTCTDIHLPRHVGALS